MPANDDGAQIRLNIIGANTQEHVTWIHSFVSIDRKKTFCVYEGPTPEAVRLAASQNNLLRAHGLLMASRENYDDAKAIVLRVRADMNRERKVEADIIRYWPQLLLYYICWGITLGVLFLLKALFVGITDAVGVDAFAAMYNPMLFGIAGALISGYLTLERHRPNCATLIRPM